VGIVLFFILTPFRYISLGLRFLVTRSTRVATYVWDWLWVENFHRGNTILALGKGAQKGFLLGILFWWRGPFWIRAHITVLCVYLLRFSGPRVVKGVYIMREVERGHFKRWLSRVV